MEKNEEKSNRNKPCGVDSTNFRRAVAYVVGLFRNLAARKNGDLTLGCQTWVLLVTTCVSFFVSSTRLELKNFSKLIFKDLIESCNFAFRNCDIKVSTVIYCGRNKSVREVSPWERVKDIPVFTEQAWGVWFEYSWKKRDRSLDFWKLRRPCQKDTWNGVFKMVPQILHECCLSWSGILVSS